MQSLISCVAYMPLNTSVVHGIKIQNEVVVPSAAAERDSGTLFQVAKEAAALRAVPNFLGVVLSVGRRLVPQQPETVMYHCFWWLGDIGHSTLHEASVTGPVDYLKLGVLQKDLGQLRSIVLLEGAPTQGAPLHELLKFPEPELPGTQARVRVPAEEFTLDPPEPSGNQSFRDDEESLATTRRVTEPHSEFDSALSEISASEAFAAQLKACSDIPYEHVYNCFLNTTYKEVHTQRPSTPQ